MTAKKLKLGEPRILDTVLPPAQASALMQAKRDYDKAVAAHAEAVKNRAPLHDINRLLRRVVKAGALVIALQTPKRTRRR